MNRVCITKTGDLIEMQEGGDDDPEKMDARLETLRKNALAAGYGADEIEARWVTDQEWQEILSAQPRDEAAIARAKLKEIDASSIRSIREWVAAQPNAPQWVKDYEAQAAQERVKLK